MSDPVRCAWCDRLFRPRQHGGKQQKFCRPSCRRAFHASARAWTLDKIASGCLGVDDIRNGPPATRALLPDLVATLPMVSRGPILLRLEILPNAVDDLCRLGWLDGAGHRVDAAVVDAVAGLVERAIALRLQPY
jgi:hypothetical protein